ncbi:aminopeptidase [Enterococcus sp. MMGLQ5-2]|nr:MULTISPECIES: aminopeptidase [unclassified Enterococcus]NPD11274.1 aminopeptidase [Enterococcus sp. MMGLQ5-1]NPD36017.1 aminopeptidase [Enterococcus sp. MMGLQ5-2]
MTNFSEQLARYADLIVTTGINVKKGQTVVLSIGVDQVELAHLIVKSAYLHGAKEVLVKWQDDKITRLFIENTTDLTTIRPSVILENDEIVAEKASRISVVSSNPAAFAGVDSQRIKARQQAVMKARQKVMQATQNNDLSWTVVAAASPEWAKVVFPALSAEAAQEKLWQAIFNSVRLDAKEPNQAWEQHNDFLAQKAAWLNQYQFDALHYQAPGTDLVIGLPKNHLWEGAGAVNSQGQSFMPNMPTEEVFTAPDAKRVDGFIRATKPLSYAGTIIEGMTFQFKAGEIISFTAEAGEAVLKDLIQTDEGAKRIGEVALVPHSSPISQSDLIFFNTLFDENASNHLAIGAAYSFSIKGGTEMSEAELMANGLNRSQVHVDFMVGSAEMSIDGILENGERMPIFRNGEWAN